MMTRAAVALPGATPDSLMSYLKGLGVFRLIAIPYPLARAHWRGAVLQLESALDAAGLVAFFLDQYQPSPILSPWNAGCGFWDDQTAGQALRSVEQSTAPRLEPYRKAIAMARRCIAEVAATPKTLKDKEGKLGLLRALRSWLPEDALAWLDAAAVISDTAQFAPLLGTGGNDGRLDFSANFMQRLSTVIPFGIASGIRADRSRVASQAWLEAALFATPQPSLVAAATGQFHPGGIGGPNATSGFEGDSLVNPWDFILMLEGALLLSGAATRRLGVREHARAAFPFTVATTSAGQGALADSESSSARAEVWLPTWPRPAVYGEVRRLFAEGRAQVGRRPARTGLDFAMAVASLGVDRGIDDFTRFAFVQRSGLNYLATPLGRYHVRDEPTVRLLDQADYWLNLLRKEVGENAPASLRSALRQIEDAAFAYCSASATSAPASRLQDVLAALGRAERLLARRAMGSAEPSRTAVRPLYDLDPAWLTACDDGRPELHLAAAVASIDDRSVGPIRQQLEPVRYSRSGYAWSDDPSGVASGGEQVTRVLAAALERRLLLGQRGAASTEAVSPHEGQPLAPLRSPVQASLSDIHAFLAHRTQDDRLLDLLYAVATFRWNRSSPRPSWADTEPPEYLSRAYALLKLLFLPHGVPTRHDQIPVPAETAVLRLLRAGRVQEAAVRAARRLYAAGLSPLGYRLTGAEPLSFQMPQLGDAERLAAALLIPISDRSARRLAQLALRLPTDQVS